MNRDRLHELEEKIHHGLAVYVKEKKDSVIYLVEVEGVIVVVAYKVDTARIVTVMPDEYLARVPKDTVTRANMLLLPGAKENLETAILEGRSKLVWRVSDYLSYHEIVGEDGVAVRVGYRISETGGEIIPNRKKPRGWKNPPQKISSISNETSQRG